MIPTLGAENGIEGTRLRLQTLDPQQTDVAAFNRLLGKRGRIYQGDPAPSEGTIATLVDGHNAVFGNGGLEDRIAALEAQPRIVPFPHGSGLGGVGESDPTGLPATS